MPFLSEDIIAKFREGEARGRLGHAYLLTGEDPDALQAMAEELAAVALGSPVEENPDFYRLRPESKSRRITVEQVRQLEKSLYLKVFRAPRKVAVIQEAERMCLGQAEAANAFLKTLEEPPNQTLLLLTSSRPSLVLPTILSRCLRLDRLELAGDRDESDHRPLLEAWWEARFSGAARAYERASLLQQFWRVRRTDIEKAAKANADETIPDGALIAMVEGDFLLARSESIAALQRAYWRKFRETMTAEPIPPTDLFRTILALEELQTALSTNINADLAVERACLRMEDEI